MAEPTMGDLMLQAARRDAAAYAALCQHGGIHDSILGFHAQQGIEKALKSTLFRRGHLVPRTHNLGQLLQALADAGIAAPPHADVIDTLDPYAVQARYGALDAGSLDHRDIGVWLIDVLDWAATHKAP